MSYLNFKLKSNMQATSDVRVKTFQPSAFLSEQIHRCRYRKFEYIENLQIAKRGTYHTTLLSHRSTNVLDNDLFVNCQIVFIVIFREIIFIKYIQKLLFICVFPDEVTDTANMYKLYNLRIKCIISLVIKQL